MSDNWNPQKSLSFVEPDFVKYGSGFLSSKPEKWLPNLSALWLPLLNIFNFDLKVLMVEPTFKFPENYSYGWVGTHEDELFGIACEPVTSEYLANLIVPNATGATSEIIQEYCVRRLIQSLASAWTGPQLGSISYSSTKRLSEVAPRAAIKIVLSLNNRQIIFWILLERSLLKLIDGLWRRQTISMNLKDIKIDNFDIEIGRFEVAIQDLKNKIKSGEEIRIKPVNFNQVRVLKEGELAIAARLLNCDGTFALEVVPYLKDQQLSDLVDVSIMIGNFDLDSQQQIIMKTVGNHLPTKLELTNRVQFKVSGEVVGTGVLKETAGSYSVIVD